MLELELVVVVVGLRSEADLFDLHTHLFLLHLFGTLLLLIEELAIVDETTNGRLCVGRDLHEVYPLLMSQVKCLTCRHYL